MFSKECFFASNIGIAVCVSSVDVLGEYGAKPQVCKSGDYVAYSQSNPTAEDMKQHKVNISVNMYVNSMEGGEGHTNKTGSSVHLS